MKWIAGLIGVLSLQVSAAEAPPAPAVEAPAASAEKKNAREPLKPNNDIPGLKNFAKVSDVLYRGEQPEREGFEALKKMGVKTIVNLRSFNSDRSKLKGLGLQYAHIYCKAWNPEDEDVIKFLKIIQDKNNHPVFVHCQHGADRTGMMVAIYRMMEQGWSIEESRKEVENFGFHKIWKDIQKYLQKFKAEDMKKKVLESDEEVEVEVVK
ncbi:MAG TPA: tyrosine-protein phosphatase [Planctomycetota bacterium]|nr:tyrosine-protein phosphatase [Planctomycetota bacterium]